MQAKHYWDTTYRRMKKSSARGRSLFRAIWSSLLSDGSITARNRCNAFRVREGEAKVAVSAVGECSAGEQLPAGRGKGVSLVPVRFVCGRGQLQLTIAQVYQLSAQGLPGLQTGHRIEKLFRAYSRIEFNKRYILFVFRSTSNPQCLRLECTEPWCPTDSPSENVDLY
jgi:hypothetical protein